MDTNRFRKRTNYALPPRRPTPVLDELGQLRQTPAQSPPPAAPPSAVSAPKPVEPPRPVYEKASPKPDDGVIDLSEPTHAGWLDAIAPELESDDEVSFAGTPTPAAAVPAPPRARAIQPAGSPVPVRSAVAPETNAEAATAALNPPQTNISIQINMPSLPALHWPKPKIKLPQLPYRRLAIWSAVGASTLLIVGAGIFVGKRYLFTHRPLYVAGGSASLSGSLTGPTFTPFVPKSKPQLAQGKSPATAFDGKRNSYSYTDNIENVPLTVSEQPVPANFSSATQAVAAIAKSFNATYTLKTAGTVAYEAKNSHTSTQTIILSLNDVLIFIQSNFPHDDGSWESYIKSLQQPAS